MEKNKIVKSFSWKILERLSIQAINLVVQVILSRLLLPEEFGLLVIIVAITNYLTIFVQTGFATAIVQKEDLDNQDVSTLLITSLAVSFVCYIIVYSCAPFFSSIYEMPELISPLRVLGIVLFFNAFYSIQSALYARDLRFKALFALSLVSVVFSGLTGIMLADKGFGIWALVIHNVLNVSLFVVVSLVRNDYKFSVTFSFSRLKKIYKFSGQILFTSVVSGLHDFLRTTVIGKYYSPEDLAYYDKGLTYSGYISNISNNTLGSVLLPFFSRQQDDKQSLLSFARKSTQMAAFIMFPILFGISAVSDSLVTIFLTEKWSSAAIFLSIFSILRLAGCLETIDKQVYYAMGNSTIYLLFESCLLVVNLVSIFVSLKFGIITVAVCATIVEFLFLFVIFFISSRVYGYKLVYRINDVFRPFVNSILMYVFVILLKSFFSTNLFFLLLQVLLGMFSYLLLAKMSKDPCLVIILDNIHSWAAGRSRNAKE